MSQGQLPPQPVVPVQPPQPSQPVVPVQLTQPPPSTWGDIIDRIFRGVTAVAMVGGVGAVVGGGSINVKPTGQAVEKISTIEDVRSDLKKVTDTLEIIKTQTTPPVKK